MPATVDRGEIQHLLGRHHLSPAVRDGAPALAAEGEQAGRTGWEPFFRALSAHGLAVLDAEGGPPRLVPRERADAHRPAGRAQLAEARRFLAAWRGRWPA